jgi:hypothetical protein
MHIIINSSHILKDINLQRLNAIVHQPFFCKTIYWIFGQLYKAI